jgi:hypothetical protein
MYAARHAEAARMEKMQGESMDDDIEGGRVSHSDQSGNFSMEMNWSRIRQDAAFRSQARVPAEQRSQ